MSVFDATHVRWRLIIWPQYGIFFASAGHAALIDYPHATDLKKIAAKVWKNGGVVSAVLVLSFHPPTPSCNRT